MRIILALLFLFNLNLYAQNTISGSVSNAEGEKLSAANVMVKKYPSLQIITFASTKSDGLFSISIQADAADSVIVLVTKMGYVNQEFVLPNKNHNLHFKLEKGAQALKEFVVESPPIRKKGDTLNYKVESFKGATDRSIGDVIKKLPGIDVKPDGTILYQGEPINRYYIDNLNLLGGKYGIANENLPHGKVATVQIFENHQPIRALDSLSFSERAAINIKLTNKITRTSILDLGLGFSPTLWDANLTNMVFIPKFQFIASAQSNNAGKNLRNIFGDKFFFEMNEQSYWLDLKNISKPTFTEKRWLNNQDHALSINSLKRLKNDFDFKVNSTLNLDYQKQIGSEKNTYIINDEKISYQENNLNRFRKNHWDGSFEFNRNDKKIFFENTLKFMKDWEALDGTSTRIDRKYLQDNKNHLFEISNSFHSIIRKSDKTFHFYSLTDFKNINQTLEVNFTGIDSSATPLQEFSYKNFNTHNYTEFSFKLLKNLRLSNRIGSQIQIYNTKSDLKNHSVNQFTQNDFSWNQFKTYFNPNFILNKKNWNSTLQLPIQHYFIEYKEKGLNKNFNKILLEPSLSYQYKFDQNLKLNSGISYSNQTPNFGSVYTGNIMTNYLNVNRKNIDLLVRQSLRYNLNLSYSNAISGINARLNWLQNFMYNPSLYNSLIHPDGSVESQALALKNKGKMQAISAQGSKYFFPLKTTIDLEFRYSELENERLINSVFKTFKNQNFQPRLKISRNSINGVNFSLLSNNVFSKNKTANVKSFAQEMNINGQIFKNTLASLTYEQTFLVSNTQNQQFNFVDFMIRWAFPKTKTDLEINFSNIFNQNLYKNIYVSDLFIQETNFQLRPRQVLIKTRFNF